MYKIPRSFYILLEKTPKSSFVKKLIEVSRFLANPPIESSLFNGDAGRRRRASALSGDARAVADGRVKGVVLAAFPGGNAASEIKGVAAAAGRAA